MRTVLNRCSWLVTGLVAAVLFNPADSVAAQDRLSEGIDNSRVSVLKSGVHPLARREFDRGPLDPATLISGVSLDLQPTAEQQAALEAFLEEQRNPNSPDYRHWLTPQEFADRFGLSESDVANVSSWLSAQGFTVEHVGEARNWILFSGTAGQIRRAFHTALRHYQVGTELHFANDSDPSIPAALTGIVSSIRGLDDFRPQPSHRMKTTPYFDNGGTHYLAPDDLAAIYDITALYQAGYDGTGMKLVIAGQTDVSLSDLRAFRSQFGLAARDPQIILAGADPGTSQADLVEATLDLEWAGAVARNATVIYVNSNNVFTSVQYAINQNLAPVISLSYGTCELGAPSSFRNIAQQAAAQGITWMTASGDTGAAACDYGASVATHGPSVSFPADIPEIVAVGGTEFAESGSTGWSSTNGPNLGSAQGYLPETAWNDGGQGRLESGGGGVSVLFAKPSWQAGAGVPDDGKRDVPDVALTASGAHDGYLIYSGGSLTVVGGTSAASPSFAGIVTLLNHYLTATGVLSTPGLGNLNPSLYALAQSTTDVFHDITTGSNIVQCVNGTTGCVGGSFGYSAGAGYDLATGLGSVDAYKLATEWNSLQSAVATTTALTANPTSIDSTASTQLTATVTPASGTNAPAGSVTFTVAGVKLGTAAVSSSGSGTSATATMTLPGSALATGANTITATYSPSGSFRNSSGSATVTVAGPANVSTTTTITASQTGLLTTSTMMLTVLIAPASGTASPTGTVTLTVGTTLLATANVAASSGNGKASFLVKGTAFPVGADTVTATYVATGNFSNSSGAVSVTVTTPPVATKTTLAVSAASLTIADSTTITAMVTPTGSSGAPTGTVTFYDGATAMGTATLTASGSVATASMTVAANALIWGSNSLTAKYGGDSSTRTTFSASASSATTVSVTSATTVIVATSLSIVAQSAAATITVTMQADSGKAPTGKVTLSSGNLTMTASLAAGATSSTATFSVKGSSLTVGNDTLTATFAATTLFLSSQGTVAVTVLPPPVPTTTTLAVSATSIGISGSTTLTATVTPTTGTAAPTGTVTFYDGTASIGTEALTASGSISTASMTVAASSLIWGSNSITAKYSGDGNVSPVIVASASAATTVSVTSATTMTVTTSLSTVGQTGLATITVTMQAASGKGPTGSVTLTSGSLSLTASLRAGATSSTATFSVKGSSLAIGSNTLTATYAATTLFLSSQGTVEVTALPAPVPTTTTLAVSATSIGISGSTTLTATVTPTTGTAAPTGTVTFYDGTAALGTEALTASGSIATASMTLAANSLAWGSNSLTAKYSGDTSVSPVIVASASVATTASVTSATTMTVTTNLSTVAQSAVATITVTMQAASGKAPTGSVTLTSGSLSLTAILRAGTGSSTAVFLVKGSSLAVGANTLTAAYAGTTLFLPSQGTVAVTAP